jgi:selenocysteine-specific elongation factor
LRHGLGEIRALRHGLGEIRALRHGLGEIRAFLPGRVRLGSMHVIGTAGHVDHGKSTLVERLTGIDPDRFEEEKRRGLTIDLGFAWLTLPSGEEIGIVDVPGHERFIKNMLAGAGGISVCLFVVAANEGWMPQSAEHLSIIDLLGVRHGVVALTKSDTVDEEVLKLAMSEVEARLAQSSLEGAPVIPCSGVTGAGVDDLIAALDAAVAAAPPPLDTGRPRLWVDRVFTIAGAGTVVTGTLAGGSFRSGDEVEIAPEGRAARIRRIQSHHKEVQEIFSGNRTALNLAGLDKQGARRGDAVVQRQAWRSTRLVDVQLHVVPSELAGFEHELSEKGAHLLYVGSAETPVKIRLLSSGSLSSGGSGVAELYLRDPLPLARGDRFVLRDAGRVLTFGGGVILDPLPARPAPRGDKAHAALLERLCTAGAAESLVALVDTEGRIPVSDALFRSGAPSVPPEMTVLGDVVWSPARHEDARRAVRNALAEHHRAQPLQKGMDREALRAVVDVGTEEFNALLGGDEQIVEEGKWVHLASHRVALDPAQEKARAELLARLDGAAFTPPLTKELDGDPALLRALSESGELVRIGDFYLSARRAAEARARIRERIEKQGPATVAEIRDLLGTTRKYAVPLCEWLDSTGATVRRGDVRALGPTP